LAAEQRRGRKQSRGCPNNPGRSPCGSREESRRGERVSSSGGLEGRARRIY
jgi:hypothetical protein